ncbi:hypothetical protein KBI33_01475 [Candidatus Shapirobacteria bacterium]|nr:hypothetical protein [Candidatus Shapirobacteria bacterium]
MSPEGKPWPTVFFLHAYQPPRELSFPDGCGGALSIYPEVNEQIYREVYWPILVKSGERFPQGMVFSFYSTLREWLKTAHPADFREMVDLVNRQKDPEYRVLGDPFIHAILPLLPEDDQGLLLNLGKEAFREDFGFDPKGLWLPETAVSLSTLEQAKRAGYEFVVLRDDQVAFPPGRKKEQPIFISLPSGGEVGIFCFEASESGKVAFNDGETTDAVSFWERHKYGREQLAIGVDMETFGHHKRDREKFLLEVLSPNIFDSYGIAPLNLKEALIRSQEGKTYGELVENSSWSCPHELGRWQGTCFCDSPSPAVLAERRELYEKLTAFNGKFKIGEEKKADFIERVLRIRGDLFAGRNFEARFCSGLADGERKQYLGKLYSLLGFTSCGWFWGGDNRRERLIAKRVLETLEAL